jgi:hypothetical protein
MRRMWSLIPGLGEARSIALICLAFAGAAHAAGSVAAAAAGDVPKPVSTSSNDPRDIDGVWWTPGYDRKFRTVEGELPPFTERGRREWEHNVAADKAGMPVADAPTGCLPHGIPRLLASPYPIQIITTPEQMTWVHEVNRNQRWIYMNEAHPPNLPKTYLGHSVGRWEGDTLVIDTVALNDRTRIDEEGITHSDQLHVVERIRKVDGGAQLENLITITDPVMFTKPWTTKRMYKARPEVRLMEYVCEENNRNAPVDGITRAK